MVQKPRSGLLSSILSRETSSLDTVAVFTIGPDQQIKLKLLHFLYGHFPLFVATDRFSIFFATSMYRLQIF